MSHSTEKKKTQSSASDTCPISVPYVDPLPHPHIHTHTHSLIEYNV